MPSLESVPKSPAHVCPPLNGMKIPVVAVKHADGADFDHMAAIKARPAVLVFFETGGDLTATSSWFNCATLNRN